MLGKIIAKAVKVLIGKDGGRGFQLYGCGTLEPLRPPSFVLGHGDLGGLVAAAGGLGTGCVMREGRISRMRGRGWWDCRME